MMGNNPLALWLPFGVALLLSGALLRFSNKTKRFIDHPSGNLKPHSRPVPRIGGIAMGIALFLSLQSKLQLFSHPLPLGWQALLFTLFLLGSIDDLRPLSPQLRLAVQLLAGALWLPAAWGWNLSAASALWGAVALVATVNAINWNDGRNGLAAASLLGIFLPTIFLSSSNSSTLALLGAAVLLGFLPYNLAGRLFMGDGGSYLFGAAAVLIAGTEWSLYNNWGPALGLLPLFLDAAQVMATRWSERRPLLQGDRSHLYDRLMERGWPLQALWLLYGGSALLLTLVGSLLL